MYVSKSTQWWEYVVLKTFNENNWIENFCMSRDTFVYLCSQLQLRLRHIDIHMRKAIPTEQCLAITFGALPLQQNTGPLPSIWSRTINHLYDCSRDMYMHCRSFTKTIHKLSNWIVLLAGCS